MTKLPRCPTCGNRFDAAKSEAMPFCSQRCREIDLGRWLNEEQALPALPDPDDDEVPDEEMSA